MITSDQLIQATSGRLYLWLPGCLHYKHIEILVIGRFGRLLHIFRSLAMVWSLAM